MTVANHLGLPDIEGEVDTAYITNALRRAGRYAQVDQVVSRPLKTASVASISSVQTNSAGNFVLKRLSHDTSSWWAQLVGSTIYEVELWAKGVIRSLPPPLVSPIFDIAFHKIRNEWWILMDDVEASIITRSNYDRRRFSWLFEGLAQFHARYCGAAKHPFLTPCSLERHVEIFTEPVLALAGRSEPRGWKAKMMTKPMFATTVPVLDEHFGPSGLEFYLDLCQNRNLWLGAILEFPTTLLHGDLYWKHIAPVSEDCIFLIDWNLPVLGPPPADLAWCWFINFWCFHPKNEQDPENHEALRNSYLSSLHDALDGLYSREDLERCWHLCWLKTFAQLGYFLIMPAIQSKSMEDKERVTRVCRRALDQAKWVVNNLVH